MPLDRTNRMCIALNLFVVHNSQLSNVAGEQAAQLWGICVLLFLSFLNFMIVIRNYNHLSFHGFNDIDDAEYQANPQLKKDALAHSVQLMSRATMHHTIGTRCFYLIFIILGWKVSTSGMLGASILLLPWLAYHDFV